MDFGKADYARKHPLLASVADPTRYSLAQQVEAANLVVAGQTNWYHVFVQWALPCSWDAFDTGAVDPTIPAAQRPYETGARHPFWMLTPENPYAQGAPHADMPEQQLIGGV